MPTLKSRVQTNSEDFQANQAHHQALAAELERRLEEARQGAGVGGSRAEARERHTKRGKLLARDRVRALLDPGTELLEIGALAANGMYEDAAPSAGMVAG